jgi:2-keto-4-pentenoate hydratase/2-oxohepta-3-ene-1,7-dioic acid hydratase in catechol pathway
VICIGRNYAKHVAELNNVLTGDLVVFMKSNASVSTSLSSFHLEPLHYEGEISFMVEGGRFVAVGFGLDLTKRQLQGTLKDKGLPWERAKSFTGAAVFDRFVALPENTDLSALSLELWVNGELRQQGGVTDMLFSPSCILEDLQQFLVLEDGDIVMTGTPEGVGEIEKGAKFIGRILLGGNVLVESSWLAQ